MTMTSQQVANANANANANAKDGSNLKENVCMIEGLRL